MGRPLPTVREWGYALAPEARSVHEWGYPANSRELRSLPASDLLFERRSLLSSAVFLRRLDRSAQRFHEVHDLRRLRRRGGLDDLALDLRLHDLHHRFLVLVLVAARIECVGQAFDQRLGHLELFR